MQKIGYQGIYGSYSSIAALNFFGENHDFVGYSSFQELIDDLDEGEIRYAVLPVENSTTGQIYRTLDLLKYRQSLVAIGEVMVKVTHNLIVFPGTTVEDVRYVHSHPEALGQCVEFLTRHPWITQISNEDTAKSVEHIQGLNQREHAAIASKLAAQIYGMQVICESIQDMDENTTRFLIFKRKYHENIEISTDKIDKMSCYFETRHQSGALFEVLKIFSERGYNLLSLHSRATKKSSFDYGFFLDAYCKGVTSSELRELLTELEDRLSYFRLIGIYNADPEK